MKPSVHLDVKRCYMNTMNKKKNEKFKRKRNKSETKNERKKTKESCVDVIIPC